MFVFSFRRYFGIVISHFQVAIYTARRDEMVDVVQATLFYMNPDAPIPVRVECWMFDVKFDVDVAGKPGATFNLWAKGQNEC